MTQTPKELALDRLEALARKGVLILREKDGNIMLEWKKHGRVEMVCGKATLAEAVFALASNISKKNNK